MGDLSIRETLKPLAAALCIDNFSETELEMHRQNIIEYTKNPTPQLLEACDEFHDKVNLLCGNEYMINILGA